ncbi:hypothetical protein ACFE04_020308 [Oxalis oulophora]
MASVVPDCDHSITDCQLDIEDDEDLFEIDIKANIPTPPPDYCWERYFNSKIQTGSALLANCLLPITDLSTAVPTASCNNKKTLTLLPAGKSNFFMIDKDPTPLRKLLAIAYWDDYGCSIREWNFTL